jgi:hypothetical protein
MALSIAEKHNRKLEFGGSRQILSSSLFLTKASSAMMEKFLKI